MSIAKGDMNNVALDNGARIELIAGSFGPHQGPASIYSPVHLSNVYLSGNEAQYTFPDHYRVGVLAIKGTATVEGVELPQDHMVVLSETGNSFTVTAQSDATLLVFGELED